MRCAVRGAAGKGARRALCRACVCKRGAGVQARGARGARGPRRGEGALRASVRRALGAAGCVLTPAPAPALAPAPAPAREGGGEAAGEKESVTRGQGERPQGVPLNVDSVRSRAGK